LKQEVLVLVVAALVVVGLGVVYYFHQTSGPSRPCCTTVVNSTAYTMSNPNLGIRLVISLNASTIHVGGSVNYTASVYNTRPSENNVSPASDWAAPSLILTPCGPTDSPIAYAIMPGHYVSANISEARSIDYGLMCTTVMGGVTVYSFQPTSDIASVFGTCKPNPCFTRPVSTWRVFSQYPSGAGGEFQWVNFKTGAYTVVAEDEWGDIALASFVVIPPHSYCGPFGCDISYTTIHNGQTP
jgi:hypothetical protein